MNPHALRALVALELRRVGASAARIVAAVAALVGVLVLAGWMTPARVAIPVGMVGFSLLAAGPSGVMRDKLDGGLEFLTFLPVPAGTLAAARLAYVTLASVPGGAGLALALWGFGEDEFAAAPGAPWSLVVGIWIVSLLGALLATGCALRFGVRRMGQVFVGVLFGWLALGGILETIAPEPWLVTRWLLERPGSAVALWALGLATLVCTPWLSYRLARTGIERFTPGRDRIGW